MQQKNRHKKIINIIVLLFIFTILLSIALFDLINSKTSINIKMTPFTIILIVYIILFIICLVWLNYNVINKRKDIDLKARRARAKELEEIGYDGLAGTKDPIKTVDEEPYARLRKDTLKAIKETKDINFDYSKYLEEKNEELENDAIQSSVRGDENSRFFMLSKIDEFYKTYNAPRYNDKITLSEFCEEFRNFSAGALHLYYSIEDIRRFVGALAVTKLIILQGMSGTGKTSLAYAFGEFLNRKATVVPIQPMWKERTDLIGYYNEFTKKFNETTLLYTMYDANYNKDIYITVLDEMNIARIEYYFAEFLSLLELPNPEARNLDVVSDKWDNDPILLENGKLRLPLNMWFIGTANNDDSTFAISDKVYDRAMVMNLDKKAEVFEAYNPHRCRISSEYLEKLFAEAKKEFRLSDRNLRRIQELDKYMIKTFHLTFGNRIMKQIMDYVPVLVACGGNEVQALDDILSRKVFRKLESKNPVYVRQMSENLCSYLDELFGNDKLPLCKEAIRVIEQNV